MTKGNSRFRITTYFRAIPVLTEATQDTGFRPGEMGPAIMDAHGVLYVRPVVTGPGPVDPDLPLSYIDGDSDDYPAPFVAYTVGAMGYSFDGTNWDRNRAVGDNADAIAPLALGLQRTFAELSAFNGTTFDRVRARGNNSDNNAVVTLGVLENNSYLHGYNSNNWQRLRSLATDVDGVGGVFSTPAVLYTVSLPFLFNGVGMDRGRGAGNQSDALATVTAGVAYQNAFARVFNGVTWDRARGGGTNSDNVAPAAAGAADVRAFGYIYDGATWDRWTGAVTVSGTVVVVGNTADNADGVAVTTNEALRTTAEMYGFNGLSWDRLRVSSNLSTPLAANNFNLNVVNYPYALNSAAGNFRPAEGFFIGVSTITPGGSFAQGVTSFNYLFKEASGLFLRAIAGRSDTDAQASINSSETETVTRLYALNAAGTWDRVRSAGDNADAVATQTLGHVNVLSHLFGFNGATWDRLRSAGDNSDANATATLGHLNVLSHPLGFNGVSWDRLRSGADNADNVATLALGVSRNASELFGFDGATWDRLRSGADDADNVATLALGVQRNAAELFGFDGATWDRVRSGADDADGVAAIALGVLRSYCANAMFNGATWDRMRSCSAANQSAASPDALQVGLAGTWVINATAINAVATVTRAAVAGQRHVVTAYQAGIALIAAAAAGAIYVRVTIGAVFWDSLLCSIASPAGFVNSVGESGLSIVGPVNTACTIATSGVPSANASANVWLSGYTAD